MVTSCLYRSREDLISPDSNVKDNETAIEYVTKWLKHELLDRSG